VILKLQSTSICSTEVGSPCFYLGWSTARALAHGMIYCCQQITGVKRLIYESNCAALKGLAPDLVIVVTGYENDRQLWTVEPHAAM